MEHFIKLLESISTMLGLILCTVWLRKKNVISTSNYQTFSRLITEFALPALIFLNVSQNKWDIDKIPPAMIMFMAALITMFLAWLIGKFLLRLENTKLGAFILVCGIGSSSSLGYTLVNQVWANNPQAMVGAIFISELGGTLPLFTIGAAIAHHFGSDSTNSTSTMTVVKSFFVSPMFISFVLGIACSFYAIDTSHWYIKTFYSILKLIANSFPLLVAVSIGLMLRPTAFKQLLPVVVGILAIKLTAEPLIAAYGANVVGLDSLSKQVLIIESAMPSGAVAAVLASKYNCDGGLASALTVASYMISLITIPLMFWLIAI